MGEETQGSEEALGTCSSHSTYRGFDHHLKVVIWNSVQTARHKQLHAYILVNEGSFIVILTIRQCGKSNEEANQKLPTTCSLSDLGGISLAYQSRYYVKTKPSKYIRESQRVWYETTPGSVYYVPCAGHCQSHAIFSWVIWKLVFIFYLSCNVVSSAVYTFERLRYSCLFQ